MASETGINKRFRENVRKERDSLGWSQGELARRLSENGWSTLGHQTTVARIENGSRPPKLDEATAIADVLGTNLETLTQDPGSYTFRRTEQKTWGLRQQLAHLGVDYLEQQRILRNALGDPAFAGDEEDLGRARRMVEETPGDAAMSAIKLMMQSEGYTDFEAFRDHWHELLNEQSKRSRMPLQQEDQDDA